jgi:hypothetical protein
MTDFPFEIHEPDADGHVWLVAGTTAINLGTEAEACEAFSQWLGQRDYQERGDGVVNVKRGPTLGHSIRMNPPK